MPDRLDEMLGIDATDPLQRLAIDLVEADYQLLSDLVALRVAQHLTQSEVGQRMGVTQPAVAAFERAGADPKLSTIRRYAMAVGALVRHTVSSPAMSLTPVIHRTSGSTTTLGATRHIRSLESASSEVVAGT